MCSFRGIFAAIIEIFNSMNIEAKILVLETMKKEGIALNAGKIVELTNLYRKVVDKAITELNGDELICSSKRCYWQAKQN